MGLHSSMSSGGEGHQEHIKISPPCSPHLLSGHWSLSTTRLEKCLSASQQSPQLHIPQCSQQMFLQINWHVSRNCLWFDVSADPTTFLQDMKSEKASMVSLPSPESLYLHHTKLQPFCAQIQQISPVASDLCLSYWEELVLFQDFL